MSAGEVKISELPPTLTLDQTDLVVVVKDGVTYHSAIENMPPGDAISIQGNMVAATSPVGGQVLTWDNSTSTWAPQSPTGTGDMLKSVYDTNDNTYVDNAEQLNDGSNVVTAAQGQTAYTHSQVVTGNPHNLDAADVGADPAGTASGLMSTHNVTYNHVGIGNAVQIQSRDVAITAPSDGQVLTWDSGFSAWIPQDTSGDMLKSVYDTTDNGFVDAAEMLNDGSNVVTATAARDHINAAYIHRQIDDFGTSNTDLWSAEKIANEISSAGGGDMLKSTYDITDNGRVDNAEQLNDGINIVTALQGTTAYTHSQIITGNPHSVTKADVGLGNVPNVDTTNASNIISGTLASSIIPPVALTSVTVVTDEISQLALIAEEGDVAVRSDLSKSYMHNGGSAGTMADWTELQTPSSAVLSVNSETGTVILTTSDISEDVDHNYVTDAEKIVIANTSGVNTGDITVLDSSEINFTLTGQQITANLITGSIDETKLNTSVNTSLDLADSSLQSSNFIDDDTMATATATTISSSESIKAYVDNQVTGSGDMLKSTYDVTDNGRVDNAEQLNDGTNTLTALQGSTAYTHSQIITGNPHNLDATDVSADPVGTASGLMNTHNSTYNHTNIGNATQIQSRAVANTAPTSNQYIKWNGSQWAPATHVDTISGHIETADNKSYTLDQSAAYSYNIKTLAIQSASGTCTAALKINGTNVTGISAVSVSSTEATGTATGAFSVAIGDTVTLVISSNSNAVDVAFTTKIERF